MAIGVAIAAGLIAVGSLAYSLYISHKAQGQESRMRPSSLDDFGMTQSTEGIAVKYVLGKNRIDGSLLWYGNLVTEEVTESAGGKGGGGEQVTGYRYYLDCWQCICLGKITIEKTYINDDEETVIAASTTFNDGTDVVYPTEPGEYASKLPGIAHVFYKTWLVGENTTQLPIVHFVVNRVLPTTVDYANLATGSNPAAAVYDVCLLAGADPAQLDLPAFNVAAAYYNTREYGVNLVFSEQTEAPDIIQKILDFVGGIFYLNSSTGLLTLKAEDPAEAAVDTLDADDFVTFKFRRRSYHEGYNDFKATIKQEDKDFTRRNIAWDNPAHAYIIGRNRPQSLDLSSFIALEPASKRLTELGKQASYPLAEIEFSTNLFFDHLQVGDPIEISHSDYSISSAGFRLVSREESSEDTNKISFKAVQRLETLFDDVYTVADGSNWTEPDNKPIALVKQACFELPYNSVTQDEPAFLLLAAREKGIETSFELLYSLTGSDYLSQGNFSGWAQHGTLDQEYSADTYKIDDTATGLLYTPHKDDPVQGSIARADLFDRRRVAIVDNEIMAYQTVTPVGPSSYRLTGIIRGLFDTAKATHSLGAVIWLVDISERNIFRRNVPGEFYLKYLPKFGGNVLAAGSATAITVTPTSNGLQPFRVGRIEATRTGTSVAIQLWPRSPGMPGAGDQPETETDSPPPFAYEGDFEISGGVATEIKQSDSFTIVQAGAFDLTVKSRLNGYYSSGKTVSIDAGDGIYIA